MHNKEQVSKKALGTLTITVTIRCKVTPETKSLLSYLQKGKQPSLW